MASGFVSASQLDEDRQKRQEEWEKVRKPDDPEKAPEIEVCNKTLFEQLQLNRDKKQAELDEQKKFKNMIRGVDEDESEFLDMINKKKAEEERRKRQEDAELLASIANKVIPATEPSLAQIRPVLKPSTSAPKSIQKTLLQSAIKRKSASSNSTDEQPDAKTARSSSSSSKADEHIIGEHRTVIPAQAGAARVVGCIPGIVAYGHSSSEDDSSDSESIEEDLTNVVVSGKNAEFHLGQRETETVENLHTEQRTVSEEDE